MMLSKEELEAIDDWRFKTRVATRSEAIRRLCKLALILDGRMEGLFDYRLRTIGALGRLGETLEYHPSTETPEHIVTAWMQIKATEALLRVIDPKRSNPQNVVAAMEEALITVSDLTGRIKELSDATITLRNPSEIEQVFADLDLNTEIWNRVLGRPSVLAELSVDEIVAFYKEATKTDAGK